MKKLSERITVFILVFTMLFAGSAVQALADEDGFRIYEIDSMEMKRGWSAAAVWEDKAYVLGGEYEGKIDVLDLTAQRWMNQWYDPKIELPTYLHGPAAEAYNGKIYVIGGIKDNTNKAVNTVHIYDIENDSWSEGAPMPITRRSIGSVLVGDEIYVMGGFSNESARSTRVDIYNITNDEWSRGTDCSSFSINFESRYSLAEKDGKIYLGGILSDKNTKARMFIYDIATDKWIEGPQPPTPRGYDVAEIINGKLVVLGNLNGDTYAKVDILDLEIYPYSWQTMDTDHYGLWKEMSSIVYNDKIYVFGGHDGKTRESSTVKVFEFSDTEKVESGPLQILLQKGESVQLAVTNNTVDNHNYAWANYNSTVVTVNTAGIVTAIDAGTAKISVNSSDFTDSIYIKVIDEDEEVDERLKIYLNIGESKSLYLNEDYDNINWQSMDPNRVSVSDSGRIRGESKGQTIITAEYQGETKLIYVYVD